MKKKILGATAVLLLAGFAAFNVNLNTENKENDFLSLTNIEALAGGESGTTNTGPGKTYDCPGLGTGDGKMCMSENTNPCTQIPC